MGQVTSPDGYEIAYDVAGGGDDVVVLLGGLMMNRGRWKSFGYVDRLVPTHRVLSIDPLGHGGSEKPRDPDAYRRPAVVGHCLAVLDAEGVDAAHLWGYSRGSMLAGAVADAAPHRVRTTILGGVAVRQVRSASDIIGPGQLDALEAGDWDSYWRSSVPMPLAVRDYMESTNDPLAIAAAGRVLDDILLDSDALPPTAYLYFADGEVFADGLQRELDRVGVAYDKIHAAGHAEGFMAVDQSCELVMPRLRRR